MAGEWVQSGGGKGLAQPKDGQREGLGEEIAHPATPRPAPPRATLCVLGIQPSRVRLPRELLRVGGRTHAS